jgi:hypothetical protein
VSTRHPEAGKLNGKGVVAMARIMFLPEALDCWRLTLMLFLAAQALVLIPMANSFLLDLCYAWPGDPRASQTDHLEI